MCSEDLDRIQDQINSMEDENYYDHIAPVTQNTERQDEFEDEQDFHPDIKENYDLSGDLVCLQLLQILNSCYYMENKMMFMEKWFKN